MAEKETGGGGKIKWKLLMLLMIYLKQKIVVSDVRVWWNKQGGAGVGKKGIGMEKVKVAYLIY